MTWITDEDKARVAEMTEIEDSIKRAARYLAWMKQRSSSLTLDWGEDTDQWECSLISGGDRFTGVARTPLAAAEECYGKVLRAMRGAS